MQKIKKPVKNQKIVLVKINSHINYKNLILITKLIEHAVLLITKKCTFYCV